MTEAEVGDLVLVIDGVLVNRVGRHKTVGFVFEKVKSRDNDSAYKVNFSIDPRAETRAVLLCTERQILPIPNDRETVNNYFAKTESFK